MEQHPAKVVAWLLATRPKTLPTAIFPFFAGTLLAFPEVAKIDWSLLLFAVLSGLSLTIGNNFVNDALDFKRGADTEERLGPRRATQSGWLSFNQVYAAGLIFLALAFVFAIPLIEKGGAVIVYVLILSVLSAYCYTGGPFPLAYHGFGELFVMLFYGLVAVCSAFWLQTGYLDSKPILLGAQVGSLCTVFITINNTRDYWQDLAAGKRTLAARFGLTFGKMEITCFALLPFLLNLIWGSIFDRAVAIIPLLSLPFALILIKKVWCTEPGKSYNDFMAIAAILLFSFCSLLAVSFVLAAEA